MNAIRRMEQFGLTLVLAALVGAAFPAAPPQETRLGPASPLLKDPAGLQRIEKALPAKAVVSPLKPRRLLIFDGNAGYGGHGSIPYANQAFSRMGELTGAYATVVSRDPAAFEPENLRRFDAVFFNNTVGNLFTNAGLRQSLVEFVYGGGGLLGVHGTSVAFTRWPGAIEDWPEFGHLLGARGASHRESDEQVIIKLDDPAHPLNQFFPGNTFAYRDEFFRFHDPYSRNRVRVLLSIDTEKTDLNQGPARGQCLRADNDYALAWVRHYGRGRVFYSTIAHNPYVFWDPTMLEFYLAAVQFALGDLPAPTIPSGKMTPGIRARETLGWRLGVRGGGVPEASLFETIDQSARLGLCYIGGASSQRVSKEMPRPFDPQLSDEDLRLIRLQLDEAGVRLLTYTISQMPEGEPACRDLFAFGRKMGVEVFIAEPALEALDTLEKLCDEYEIGLALQDRDWERPPHYQDPAEVRRVCQGRSDRIGACGDLGQWARAGLDPIQALRTLKERLILLSIPCLAAPGAEGPRPPGESDFKQIEVVLGEMHRAGLQPAMLSLDRAPVSPQAPPETARLVDVVNGVCVRLSK